MSGSAFTDTNVLIYAIGSEAEKRHQAESRASDCPRHSAVHQLQRGRSTVNG